MYYKVEHCDWRGSGAGVPHSVTNPITTLNFVILVFFEILLERTMASMGHSVPRRSAPRQAAAARCAELGAGRCGLAMLRRRL